MAGKQGAEALAQLTAALRLAAADSAPSIPAHFRTQWSTSAEWAIHVKATDNPLVTAGTSRLCVVCSSDELPRTGQHYFEIMFTEKPVSKYLFAVGLWGSDTKLSHAEITRNKLPFWGLRGDNDKDALRIEGRGKGRVGLNAHGAAISANERVGVHVDLDRKKMMFFRNGVPIEGATISGLPTRDFRIAATFSRGQVALSFPNERTKRALDFDPSTLQMNSSPIKLKVQRDKLQQWAQTLKWKAERHTAAAKQLAAADKKSQAILQLKVRAAQPIPSSHPSTPGCRLAACLPVGCSLTNTGAPAHLVTAAR